MNESRNQLVSDSLLILSQNPELSAGLVVILKCTTEASTSVFTIVSPSLKMLGYNNMEKEKAVKTNSVSDITKLNKHTSHFTT
jgi:hypothetical protein